MLNNFSNKMEMPVDATDEERLRALVETLSGYIEIYHGGAVEMISYDGETLKIKMTANMVADTSKNENIDDRSGVLTLVLVFLTTLSCFLGISAGLSFLAVCIISPIATHSIFFLRLSTERS